MLNHESKLFFKFLSFFLLLNLNFSNLSVKGQQIEKSYIVVGSDTIFGAFKNPTFDKTPSNIEFKANGDENWRVHLATEISSFSCLGVTFESHRVTTDFASQSIEDIHFSGYSPALVDSVLFLRLLWKSELLSFYEMADRNNSFHYYIKKKNNAPLELVRRPYIQNNKLGYVNLYWATLKECFQDCGSINDKIIAQTKFSKTAFKAIIERYLACKNVQRTSVDLGGGAKSRLNLYLGGGLNDLVFSTSASLIQRLNGLSSTNFPAFLFQAGLSYEIFPSKLNPKISIAIDLGIKSYRASGSRSFSSIATGSGSQNYVLDFSYIRFSPFIRYFFNQKNRALVFVNFGAFANQLISFNSSYQLTTVQGNTIVDGQALTTSEYGKIEIGFLVGTGLRLGRYTFELRGELGNGVLQSFVNYSSSTRGISLITSYNLVK